MTIDNIYEIALYLGEKTDDDTGFINDEYKKQHRKKAEILIKQAIRRFCYLESISLPDIDNLPSGFDIPLPDLVLKNIIPSYIAAILCRQDCEEDKYNYLIFEYEKGISEYKHREEQAEIKELIQGLED